MELIFEKSRKGAPNAYFPEKGLPGASAAREILPKNLLRTDPSDPAHRFELPELSELEVVRHVLGLCRRQVGIDSTFYPLG